MTRASTRFVPHILVLLVLAGVPTLLHSYGRFDVEDCRNPAALMVLHNGSQRASWVRERWLERASATREWRQGKRPIPATLHELRTVVVRTYDPKIVYHQPEIALVRGFGADAREVEWIEHAGEALPVHRPYFGIHSDRPAKVVAAYLLVYRGRPVANPYLAQLLAAPLELASGRSPMTLFFATATVGRGEVELAEEAADRWLAETWSAYRSACHP